MPTVRDIPPEILKGLQEVPAWVQSTAADQQKIVAFIFRVANTVARIDRDFAVFEQRRENGELLAPEGQAARSRNTSKNDRILCKLYQSVRGSFPSGGKGNTAALNVVRQRHQRKTNRERPVDRKTVRNALKRAGIPCE